MKSRRSIRPEDCTVPHRRRKYPVVHHSKLRRRSWVKGRHLMSAVGLIPASLLYYR